MRYFLSSIFLILFCSALAHDLDRDLNRAYALLDSDLDSASIVAKDILEYSRESADLFGEVQACFILAYTSNEMADYGAAVVYYLEAIRKAEIAEYETVLQDKISLRKNIANIFRRFQANGLAIKYNLEGIEIAKEANDVNQIKSIGLNLGLVYENDQQYSLGLQTFEDLLEIADFNLRLDLLNQIGIIYLKLENYDKAQSVFKELEKIAPVGHTLSAKAKHNLGEILYQNGDVDHSVELLRQSVAIFESNGDKDLFGSFNSFHTLGTYLVQLNEFEAGEKYLLRAIELFDFASHKPKSFEVYKTISNFYFQQGDRDKGSFYQDRYFHVSQEYIERQQEIQKKDKEYNFELITKRYFDDVKKQDRMASILMYSRISSGGLVFLLLMVIAYYQMEKRRLRKSIELELKALKMVK